MASKDEDEDADEEEEEEDEEEEEEAGPKVPSPSEELAPGEATTMTEPRNLGPLEPGTAVKLKAMVETDDDLGRKPCDLCGKLSL